MGYPNSDFAVECFVCAKASINQLRVKRQEHVGRWRDKHQRKPEHHPHDNPAARSARNDDGNECGDCTKSRNQHEWMD